MYKFCYEILKIFNNVFKILIVKKAVSSYCRSFLIFGVTITKFVIYWFLIKERVCVFATAVFLHSVEVFLFVEEAFRFYINALAVVVMNLRQTKYMKR